MRSLIIALVMIMIPVAVFAGQIYLPNISNVQYLALTFGEDFPNDPESGRDVRVSYHKVGNTYHVRLEAQDYIIPGELMDFAIGSPGTVLTTQDWSCDADPNGTCRASVENSGGWVAAPTFSFESQYGIPSITVFAQGGYTLDGEVFPESMVATATLN